MKTLSNEGTATMFLVGGGILDHNISSIRHLLEPVLHSVESIQIAAPVTPILLEGLVGVVAGEIALFVVKIGVLF